MSTKTCNISKMVQDRTKVTMTDIHMRFRFVPHLYLGRPWTAVMHSRGKNCFTEPTRKIWMKTDPCYQCQTVGQWF